MSSARRSKPFPRGLPISMPSRQRVAHWARADRQSWLSYRHLLARQSEDQSREKRAACRIRAARGDPRRAADQPDEGCGWRDPFIRIADRDARSRARRGPDAFLDTAAVMMHLDLIVTSDTSIRASCGRARTADLSCAETRAGLALADRGRALALVSDACVSSARSSAVIGRPSSTSIAAHRLSARMRGLARLSAGRGVLSMATVRAA